MDAFCLAALVSAATLPASQRLPHAHSHNDYAQHHPLVAALAAGFGSVEVDLWGVDGQIVISHWGLFADADLEKDYLLPLAACVARLHSVYGDGQPFLLWLDFKENDPELLRALDAVLDRYPTLFQPTAGHDAPVTIVLTGHDEAKRAFARLYPRHLNLVDSQRFSENNPEEDEPSRCYSLRWPSYFRWNGDGEMSGQEKSALRRLVDAIHRRGSFVRFWAAPDDESFWRMALEAGVDFINTDRIEQLAAFLRQVARAEAR